MLATENYEQKKQALEAVLASGIFERSPSLAQVLSYICAKYFEGTADEIKEYNIAIDALGRSPEFDQKKDSIVRVQVYRLRERLAEYYSTAGASSEIVIEIPQGQYIPRFIRRSGADFPRPLSVSLPMESAFTLSGGSAVRTDTAPETPGPTEVAPSARPTGPNQPSRSMGRALFDSSRRWMVMSLVSGTLILLAWIPLMREKAGRASNNMPPLPPISASDSIRILAGYDGVPFTDGLGHSWMPDQNYTGGSAVTLKDHRIFGTREPELYQFRRQGTFSYNIPLKPGTYELRLHFAETHYGEMNPAGYGGEGTRAFAIRINGQVAIPRLDVTGEVGPSTADTKVFKDITPGPDGMLRLSFDPIVSIPFINAIELTPGIPGKLRPIRLVEQDHPYRDTQGREWEPDRYAMGGQVVKRNNQVAAADDPQLFAGERFGNLHYSIPVPPDKYSVTFYMAERWLGPNMPGGSNGVRVFDILCNGVALARDFEVAKRAGGPDRALVQTFHGLTPNHQDKLDLSLIPNKNFPMLSALEVLDETR